MSKHFFTNILLGGVLSLSIIAPMFAVAETVAPTLTDQRQTFYKNPPPTTALPNSFSGAGCYTVSQSQEGGSQFTLQGQPQSGTCYQGDTYLGADGQPTNPANIGYVPLEPLPGMPVGAGNTQFSVILNYAFKLLLTLGVMFAVGSLVIGGIIYMTSEVVSGKDFAKKRIRSSLLGLLLLLAAWLILYTINPQLVVFSNSLNPDAGFSNGNGQNQPDFSQVSPAAQALIRADCEWGAVTQERIDACMRMANNPATIAEAEARAAAQQPAATQQAAQAAQQRTTCETSGGTLAGTGCRQYVNPATGGNAYILDGNIYNTCEPITGPFGTASACYSSITGGGT